MKRCFLAGLILLALGANVHADITYSTAGSTYSQTFDSLIPSGTSQAWANDSTLQGWNLFQSAGSAITTYSAGDGGTNAGSFYSFGTINNTDRALGGTASGGAYFGSPASGALAGHIAVQITNNTGILLNSFSVGFDGEQWRNGGNTSAQVMKLEYGFGSTFASVTTWNAPGGTFDFTSPVIGATAAAVDGNAAGLVAGLGGSVNGLSWNDGESLWIRWIENNDVGNDHGMGIDNFTFSGVGPSAAPEPTTMAAFGAFGAIGGIGAYLKRRKQKKAAALEAAV